MYICIFWYSKICLFLVKNANVSRTQGVCHVIHIAFGTSLLRYNYATFHHCRIFVTDFREGAAFLPTPHPWAAPKKPILNRVKTMEMCNKTMCINPAVFFLNPDNFKTQEMCIEGIEVDSWQLHHVPDRFETQKMYDKAVREDPSSLEYVPLVCDAREIKKIPWWRLIL